MKRILIIILFISPLLTLAQQPKMHMKLYGGLNTTTFVYKVEGADKNVFTGWQVGGSFRVIHRQAFLEIAAVYKNYGITLDSLPAGSGDYDVYDDPITIKMKALEFPLTMGYVAVKKPVFKWFFYGGLVSRFSLRGKYEYQDESGTYKPSELDLNFYHLGTRFGTQIDVAFFNIDFNYTIGVTNAFSEKARTNTHGLEMTLGILW